MPFDALDDFTHMGMLVEAPRVLVVRAQSPFRNLDPYVAAARSKPVHCGTSGIGSANQLFGELLKIEAKAPQHDHVPYQGSARAMQDLLGGQIDGVFDPITTNVATLKAGSLRALAVSTPRRLPALPGIPTFAEQGLPKLTDSQWLRLSAPKGPLIPDVLARPVVAARLDELQTLPRHPSPVGDGFVQLVRSQIDSTRAVARASTVEVVA